MLNFAGIRGDGSKTIHWNGAAINGSFFQQSSFASHALATERNIVKVGKDLPLELLGPLGCGIQTGAGAVMNTLRAEAGASIVVFGAGSVGLSAVMAARVQGCTPIIVVDVNPERLQFALQLGATHIVNGKADDVVAQIQALTGGGARYSVETAGHASTFTGAIDCLAIGGACGLIAPPNNGAPIQWSPLNIVLGRSLLGVLEGSSNPDVFIPYLIDLYRAGQFPFDRLVKYYPFECVNDAIRDSKEGKVVKPILRMT